MRQHGFTLVEAMATLAIAAIVLMVGIPSFTQFIRDTQLTTTANSFVAAMHLARSEAVKRNATVNVSATAATAGNEWGGGFRVVLTDSTVLREWSELADHQALDSQGGITRFQYAPSGAVDNGDTLSLCDDRSGETGRTITVGVTGRVSVTEATCS